MDGRDDRACNCASTIVTTIVVVIATKHVNYAKSGYNAIDVVGLVVLGPHGFGG